MAADYVPFCTFTESINVVSCNIQGCTNLQTFVNRHVYSLGISQPNIIFLQELMCSKIYLPIIQRFLPAYKLYTSLLPNGGNRGVLIAVHENCEFTIHQSIEGKGNYMLIACIINGLKCILGSIYIPPNWNDCTATFNALSNHLSPFKDNYRFLLGGDFNGIFDNIDSNRITPISTRDNRVKNFCTRFECIDVWRLQHPDVAEFTCISRAGGRVVVSRIDYFLISQSLIPAARDCSIGFSGGGDHDVIRLSITCKVLSKKQFRFPHNMLKNREFRNILKFNVRTVVSDNPDCSPRTLWELIKCTVRSTSVKVACERKKSCADRVKTVEDRLTKLKKGIFMREAHPDTLVEIQTLNELRDSLFEQENSAILASNWAHSYGNRGTANKKFFTSIKDKLKYIEVSHLRDQFDVVQSHPDNILSIVRDFYDDLYRYRPTLRSESPADLCLPQIEQEDMEMLDSEFSLLEFRDACKQLKKGKAPGDDGLTVEFYCEYWDVIGEYLYAALLEAIRVGEMAPSQKRGTVKLIPKKGKDLLDVANWRGICLLNVDYKILTKVIANRLNLVLGNIIHNDQKAFISTRYLSNAIYDLYAVQKIVDEEELDVLLESLDIHKAFDSISWGFLDYAYAQFGFSEQFRNLIKTLFKNREVYISNNGFRSQKITVGRGCPQGDPLSPGNFIIAIEILANRIRYNDAIRPIEILNVKKKLNLIADDVLLMYHNTVPGCRAVGEELFHFRNNSGLSVNYGKCSLMRIGRYEMIPLSIHRRNLIPRKQRGFKYLGITYLPDHKRMASITFEEKFREIQLVIANRSKRLSQEPLLSRVYGLNSLFFSKLRYAVAILPLMSQSLLTKFQNMFQLAVWNNSRHKVNKSFSGLPVRRGGLGGMDVSVICRGYKAFALKFIFHRTESDPQFWQYQLASTIKFDLDTLIRVNLCPSAMTRFLSKTQHMPIFWKECFSMWSRVHYIRCSPVQSDLQEVFCRPVFLNSMLDASSGVAISTAICNAFMNLTYIRFSIY